MQLQLTVASLIIFMRLQGIFGHGRLWDPPARSTMWRRGFNTPANYDDNGLNCGGYWYQWFRVGGKCGICGDPWYQSPRRHEPPGRYATGTIAKKYAVGQVITVTIDITAHHKGWFEFRLCPNNDINTAATPECLDRYLLRMLNGNTRYQLPNWGSRKYYVDLQLPAGLSCQQCVLQWKWNAGNSWGSDASGSCVGCGPQEQFYGCSDIQIGNGVGGGNPAPGTPTPTPPPTTTPSPYVRPPSRCRPVYPYNYVIGMTWWCTINCAAGYCPPSHCRCT